MTHRIDRTALLEFIDAAVNAIEATPLPDDMAELAGADGIPREHWQAVWLAAGIATQIGAFLVDEPELFVVRQPPWPLATASTSTPVGDSMPGP